MAVRLWEPLVADEPDQEMEKGAEVRSAPRFTPSSWNWTSDTPTLSLAEAVTAMVAETVELRVGVVMETEGGVVSKAARVVAEAAVEGEETLPAASTAATV